MKHTAIARFSIEQAEIEDAEKILALQRLAYQSEARLYNDSNLPPLKQTLAQLMAEFDTHTILKVLSKDMLIGSVRAYRIGTICLIGRLMVEPQFQRHGIGSALIERIEALFSDVEQFKLFTGAKSDANIRLYQRLGYTIVATEQINDRVSTVIMTKPARRSCCTAA